MGKCSYCGRGLSKGRNNDQQWMMNKFCKKCEDELE